MQNKTFLIDEKHITNAFVFIGGKETDYVSLTLRQSFGEHHTFRIKLDYDAVKKNFLEKPLEQMSLIGKVTQITLQQGNDSAHAQVFIGLITGVSNRGREGRHGHLILRGKSPTTLLERGKRMDVFQEMSLEKVFKEITADIKERCFQTHCNPSFDDRIGFLMQYEESDWDFLRRLSAISGEALYYNGTELIFGTEDDRKATSVMYDKELEDLDIDIYSQPNTFTQYQYLYESDELIRRDSPSGVENSNEYIAAANDSSANLGAERPVCYPSSLPVGDPFALEEMVNRRKVSTASDTICVHGVSKTSAPHIGRLLNISIPANRSKYDSEVGTYRVISVKHTIDQNHRYKAKFTGIPANLKYYPAPKVKKPAMPSIEALVVSNADPKGLGRVMVEFPFTADRSNETWLRVMSPSAGGQVRLSGHQHGKVTHNRGMVFIPEAGERVMVAFEYGDPNRPYVTGSMFHGKNSMGGGEKNHRKSITTRSGSKLEFSDVEDEYRYSVIMQHDDKNTVSISVEKEKGTITIESTKDIYIKAPERIHMEAKEIVMKAETIQATAEDKIEAVAAKLLSIESGDKLRMAGADVAAESSGKFMQQGESIGIKASSKMDIDGGDRMNVQAGDIKMNQ